jgi:hypothetical protein
MKRPALVLVAATTLTACGGPTYAPVSLVQSVRLLAIAADQPYARPGDMVSVQALAADGRANQPEPMEIWWLPAPCIDPAGDAYYACFPKLDLTDPLVVGTSFTFQMPPDAISGHADDRGGDPYGLAVVFAMACAGHVEPVSVPAGAPADTLPFACFDAAGHQLGSDDFVFAYATVYAFATRTNANPVIDSVTLDATTLVTTVPASSQEIDPSNLDGQGNPLKELISVDYYLTAGRVGSDAVVLYEPDTGEVAGASDRFYPPQTAGAFDLWAVVRDNRGGVSWQHLSVAAQ